MINEKRPTSDIGDRLRKIRETLGLTQKAVSKLSHKYFQRPESQISAESLRKLEQDATRRPSVTKLRSLAQIFRIYPEDFLLESAGVYPNQLIARLSRYPDLRPPFDLDIARAVLVKIHVRSDPIQAFLPPGVELVQRKQPLRIAVLIQQMREASGGKHAECVFQVPVVWRGERCMLVVDHYSEGLPPICALREVYGYPAKFGHPQFTDEGKVTPGCSLAQLTISGLPILSIDVLDEPIHGFDRISTVLPRHLARKRILNPDGVTYALDQLTSFVPFESPSPNSFRAGIKVRVTVESTAYRNMFGIDGPQVVPAIYFENHRVTMPPGRIEEDYVRVGSPRLRATDPR